MLNWFLKRLTPAEDSDEIDYPSHETIMREVYTIHDKRTEVEVRSDSIRLVRNGEPEELVLLKQNKPLPPDLDEEIRFQIAKKIAHLLPTLAESSRRQLMEYTIRVLHMLAKDQTTRIRRILAVELKQAKDAPPELMQQLAYDDQAEVALPVLEFSPLLGDVELLDIISTSHVEGVAEAVARRHEVSEAVSAAIVNKEDAEAIQTLLENQGAQINEATLDQIISKASEFEMWHDPLLLRSELTLKTVNRIAEFVSSTKIHALLESHNIKPELADVLRKNVAQRLRSVQLDRQRTADAEVKELKEVGKLEPDTIDEAMIRGNVEFVVSSLVEKTGFSKDMIRRIFASQNAKAVTALAWKAGLPMRAAIQLQVKMAKIAPQDMLNAKGGVDYPLSEETMNNYLGHFTK